MNIYQRQHSKTVFDRLWCVFAALTDSQGWTPASSEGVVSSCLCAGLQSQRFGRRKHKEKMFLMIPEPADARDKRPQCGLAESGSDNCSITCPISQLVWKSILSKMSV